MIARDDELVKKVKVQTRYSPDVYDDLAYQILSATGCTMLQLSKAIKVSKTSVDKWFKNKPSFRLACQEGRDEFDTNNVEKSLLQRALGFEYFEDTYENVAVFNAKNTCGKLCIDESQLEYDEDGNLITRDMLVVTKRVKKYALPDVTAQIYWTKNRNPERWRDSKNIDVGGNVKLVLTEDKE